VSSPPARPTSTPPGQVPLGQRAGGPLGRLPKGEVRQVIAVGSGKGGVGKSSVTVMIAAELRRQGHEVGILDADVTGPSVPHLLGLGGHLVDRGQGIEPAVTPQGLRNVSSQYLLEEGSTPVIWRGPLVTRLITQFFAGVHWGALDYLLIDMPPGTSDVPLTVFQAIPIDGMVFVTTPQELAGLIVRKAINMARELHVPLLGLVENMKEVRCPHCRTSFSPYGESHARALAEEYDIPYLGGLPIDPRISETGDRGGLANYEDPALTEVVRAMVLSLREAQARTLNVL
jgi:ATP-binding protein involved in chromosome partitioning